MLQRNILNAKHIWGEEFELVVGKNTNKQEQQNVNNYFVGHLMCYQISFCFLSSSCNQVVRVNNLIQMHM